MVADPRETGRTVAVAVKWVLVAAWSGVVLYLMSGALLWCVDGAYNVLQGDEPDWGFSLFLVVLGLIPVGVTGSTWWVFRRQRMSRLSAWNLSMLWGGVVSFVVLFIRAVAAAPF